MKHESPRMFLFLQTIFALLFSAAMILSTTETGLLSLLPSGYQQKAYAQEECSWYEEFWCEEPQTSTEDAPADTGTSSDTGTSAGTCDPTVASCSEQTQYTDPVSIPDGPDTEPGQTIQVTQQECTTITHTSDAKGKACRALCWGLGAGCGAAACFGPQAVLTTCVGVAIVCGGLASECSDECTQAYPPETTTETVCKDVQQPQASAEPNLTPDTGASEEEFFESFDSLG